jgi:hypothetical protein
MLFFKMERFVMWLFVSLFIVSSVILFHYKFDLDMEHMPVFTLAIPVSVLLFVLSMQQLVSTIYEKDYVTKILNGYDQKWKMIALVISVSSTVVYVISFMTGFFLVEKLNEADTKDIMEFVLMASLIYSILQMETTGSIILDFIFEQFHVELINDSNPDKRKFFKD